jgi:hypothetical protein
VREMLGELLLDLQQPALALVAFEQSQTTDPNRFRSIYGAARAAEITGAHYKASEYYAQLLRQVGQKSANRPELSHARDAMSLLGAAEPLARPSHGARFP